MTTPNSPVIKIGDRPIGPGLPTYIIAEMSANHGHDFEKAVRILEAMKASGADAVKLQTYTPDTLTIDCDKEWFQIGEGTLWEGKNLYQLYGEAYTPWDWQPKLKDVADELDIHLFSTPFDNTAVDFLEDMDVPAHKVASFENVDLALIRKVAATGKPVIMSTGMATLGEVGDAVAAARDGGCTQLALLKCTSAYPSPPEEMDLRTIPHLAETFDVVPGLSDHTMDVAVPVAAVALGACVIEKHFTLSRDEPGPDSAFFPRAGRIQGHGRRGANHREGTRRGLLRTHGERESQPRVPSLAIRRGGYRRWRGTGRTQCPLHPSRLRARPEISPGGIGGARPQGRSGGEHP